MPELIELYDLIVKEEGEDNGKKWLIEELGITVTPRLVFIAIKVAGLAYKFWRSI